MKRISSALRMILLILAVVGVAFFILSNWSFVFAKTIRGEVLKVERVTQPTAVFGSNVPNSQVYSFAVAIRDDKQEIHIASSEDRQWAVAEKGFCIEAKFYPYPPWNFEKSGTYFNARLIKVNDCRKAPAGATGGATATAPSVQPAVEPAGGSLPGATEGATQQTVPAGEASGATSGSEPGPGAGKQ